MSADFLAPHNEGLSVVGHSLVEVIQPLDEVMDPLLSKCLSVTKTRWSHGFYSSVKQT